MRFSTDEIIELSICCVTFTLYLYWLYCLTQTRSFSAVFFVIQMMISMDAASVLMKTAHDYTCKYYNQEIFRRVYK